mgnify:CR=1 FL=1
MMTSVHDLVETISRGMQYRTRPGERPTTASLLELQIAFWSEELTRLRKSHHDDLRHLLQLECDIDTDLMHLDTYIPLRIWQPRTWARDTLKTRQFHLEMERRRTIQIHEREVRDVQVKLLELLVQRAIMERERA